MPAQSLVHSAPRRTTSSGMDTPGCPAASAAMHLSTDGPGGHQTGHRETSQGCQSAPPPPLRPIHQREETHPPDEASGKPEVNGDPPTPLRTSNQTTADTGPFQQPGTTGSSPVWTPPESSEALMNKSPTLSMVAENQETRLSAQPGGHHQWLCHND